MVLFGMTVLKLFVFDMANVQQIYRIVAFFILAIVLGLAMQVPTKPDSSARTEAESIAPILQMTFPSAAKPVQNKLNAKISRLKAHPDDSIALGSLGMTLMAYELKTAAIPCFELMAQREPKDFRWSYLLGHCRMFTDPDTAAVNFQRAAELNPNFVPAQMLLVEVLLAGGRTKEAQHRFEKDLPASIQNHPWVAWQ